MLRRKQSNRRALSPLNLAFLDIMSCGLGAVVLIFLLIKHNTDVKSPNDDVLFQDTSQLIKLSQTLDKGINELTQQMISEIKKTNISKEKLNKIFTDIKAIKESNEAIFKKNQITIKRINNQEKERATDIIELEGKGEQNYLTGMSVKGSRILLILDSSASMSEGKLADIIRRKIGSKAFKADGEKWKRALRASSWLLARLPEDSQYQFLSFNEKVTYHTPKRIWQDSGDKESLYKTISTLSELFPDKGTNLGAAFKEIGNIIQKPTDIYLITDGLPTLGTESLYSKLSKSACGGINKKKNMVTGNCREYLFNAAHKIFMKLIPNSRFNAILLPMEGDNNATYNFWKLSSATNGLTMSPSKDWP